MEALELQARRSPDYWTEAELEGRALPEAAERLAPAGSASKGPAEAGLSPRQDAEAHRHRAVEVVAGLKESARAAARWVRV